DRRDCRGTGDSGGPDVDDDARCGKGGLTGEAAMAKVEVTPATGASGFDACGCLALFAPLILLLLLMAAFAALEPRFLTPLNLFNVMRQVSIYGLLAVGMTFVILTRGIDLSVGSLVALAGLGGAMGAKGGLAR